MGCFLGCFGFSTKRKRRKSANRILPGYPRHGSYKPLDSSVSIILDIKENPISSDSELRLLKERSSIKIRKKVSFNLNVQTYEPLSKEETSYHSDEEEESEKNGADAAKASVSAVSGSDSSVSKMGSFPSNYRYQNCIDSYDDEGDMADIESDLDYDDDEDDEDEDEEYYSGNEFDDEIRQKEFLEQLNSQSMAEEKSNNHMQLTASTDGELKPVESIRNARNRSQYISSVLNPVENLTQWKAIKARTAPTKHPRMENIALEREQSVPFSLKPSSNLYPSNLESKYNQSKPLLQEIAVNASLSNWIASPNSNKSKVTSITNGRINSIENIPSKKCMFDRSCSQQSREQRLISEITNLEA
ncbi:hypothetical protein Dsin_027228 [Dipteronia sinensis]|uniref:Uncharacterized protein n=1 Tax=Dipteronia sinensis TaxID=43782 RepID=A0AAD9ZNK9_9ROSI|nr:hypothetical protein Dsin_027228 [Dipteronia sinensis]